MRILDRLCEGFSDEQSNNAAFSHLETTNPGYEQVIDAICNLNWPNLNDEDIIRVAWAYYHFSVQFRECLEIAREMYPDDERLLLIMASATPTIFRLGRESLGWERK